MPTPKQGRVQLPGIGNVEGAFSSARSAFLRNRFGSGVVGGFGGDARAGFGSGDGGNLGAGVVQAGGPGINPVLKRSSTSPQDQSSIQYASIMRNMDELQRWATQEIPIFPVYEYRFSGDGDTPTSGLTTNTLVEYPTGSPVELRINKRFDWTLVYVELSVTAYKLTTTGLVEFHVVVNLGENFQIARLFFNNVGIHHTVHGRSVGLKIPKGRHLLSLIPVFSSGAVQLDANDFILYTAQESPVHLKSAQQDNWT